MAAYGKRLGGHVDGVEEEEEEDLYAVLGLTRDCSDGDLRAAYKKLALRWHPDRCSANDSKAKFQAIQEAYSVLSDSNKRFLYDLGVYDDDDQIDGGDGQYTMGDFLGEMATMMQQNKPKDNAEPSFKELQALFFDMFDDDGANGGGASPTSPISFVDDDDGGGDSDALFDGAVADDAAEPDFILGFSPQSSSASTCSSPYSYYAPPVAGSKRAAPACDPVAADVAAGFSDLFDSVVAQAFFCGPSVSDSGSSTTERAGRKQKVYSAQDVSSVIADPVSAASY